ncbi:MAG: phage tail tape measure protein, partial [Oscillospiraceae bacterium]|nr:phage tail tape measure protein [Oscillospiraceae bacterium]
MVVQTGQVGMEFDSAMSQVAGTFGYTVEQLSDGTSEMSENMQDLRDYSKEIATTTKFSATEVAEGMNYAAMAGWKSGEILEGYKGIVDLAAASGEELALTADIVTDG